MGANASPLIRRRGPAAPRAGRIATPVLLIAVCAAWLIAAAAPGAGAQSEPWATFIKTYPSYCNGSAAQPCTIPPNVTVLITGGTVKVRSLFIDGTLQVTPTVRSITIDAAFVSEGPRAPGRTRRRGAGGREGAKARARGKGARLSNFPAPTKFPPASRE